MRWIGVLQFVGDNNLPSQIVFIVIFYTRATTNALTLLYWMMHFMVLRPRNQLTEHRKFVRERCEKVMQLIISKSVTSRELGMLSDISANIRSYYHYQLLVQKHVLLICSEFIVEPAHQT